MWGIELPPQNDIWKIKLVWKSDCNNRLTAVDSHPFSVMVVSCKKLHRVSQILHLTDLQAWLPQEEEKGLKSIYSSFSRNRVLYCLFTLFAVFLREFATVFETTRREKCFSFQQFFIQFLKSCRREITFLLDSSQIYLKDPLTERPGINDRHWGSSRKLKKEEQYSNSSGEKDEELSRHKLLTSRRPRKSIREGRQIFLCKNNKKNHEIQFSQTAILVYSEQDYKQDSRQITTTFPEFYHLILKEWVWVSLFFESILYEKQDLLDINFVHRNLGLRTFQSEHLLICSHLSIYLCCNSFSIPSSIYLLICSDSSSLEVFVQYRAME